MQWTSYLGLYSNSCLIWIQIKGRFSTCILDSVVLYSCSGQAWGAVLPPWSVNTHDFVLTDRTLTRLLNKMKELSNKWSRRTQLSLSTFPPHQQNAKALNNLREKDIWRPKVLFIPKKRLRMEIRSGLVVWLTAILSLLPAPPRPSCRQRLEAAIIYFLSSQNVPAGTFPTCRLAKPLNSALLTLRLMP